MSKKVKIHRKVKSPSIRGLFLALPVDCADIPSIGEIVESEESGLKYTVTEITHNHFLTVLAERKPML